MSRVYIIRNKADGNAVALVSAMSKTAALRHMAEQHFDVGSARQHELIDALRAGLQLQDATTAKPDSGSDE
jgi:hypothetical protein